MCRCLLKDKIDCDAHNCSTDEKEAEQLKTKFWFPLKFQAFKNTEMHFFSNRSCITSLGYCKVAFALNQYLKDGIILKN